MPIEKLKSAWQTLLTKLEPLGGFRLYMLALFVIMFLAYDSQVWRMGFYYDDWEGVFLYKQNFSPTQIWEYFLTDRPFSSLVHILFNPLFGASSVAWHIFGLVLYWAAILLFVRMLLEIWPQRVPVIGWIGLLLALYPGITRQFVIRTSMPHYTAMLLFMLSLLLLVLAFKHPRQRAWLIITSILLGCMHSLLIEYFGGLELIRIFLLFYLYRRETGQALEALKISVLAWLPYLSIFIVFVGYKFLLLPRLQIGGEAPKHELKLLEQLALDPAGTLLNFANLVTQDITHAILYVWTLPITPGSIELNARAYSVSWALALVIAMLAVLVMEAWAHNTTPDDAREPFPGLIVATAFIAVLLGGLPSWAIGRQALGGMWSSRFLFGQIFGAVSLVVLAVAWLAGQNRRAALHITLALLLAGAFSLQFRTGNVYARDWDYQRNFFWQLKWRIPALAPQAFLVSPQSATALTVDYQMAFAVNILYAPGNNSTDSQHWWFNGPEELRGVMNAEPNARHFAGRTFRTIQFESDMDYAVPILGNLSRQCLLVADPVYKDTPLLGENEKRMFLTTHPQHILPDADLPMPTDVFGPELPHGWCYYFQKADLARQFQRWDQIPALWQQAQSAGQMPMFGNEYLPFIEANARLGNWPEAARLTEQANTRTIEMKPFLCGNWQRIIADTPVAPEKDQAWAQVNALLGCE